MGQGYQEWIKQNYWEAAFLKSLSVVWSAKADNIISSFVKII